MSKNLLELKLLNHDNSKINDINDNIITKISYNQISYNEFFWNYIKPNRPATITSVSNNWKCRNQWIDINNQIQFDNLKVIIGNCIVPVADCSKEYFNSHKKCEMEFFKFLDYWKNIPNNHETNEYFYLKDWHLKAKMPNYDFYEVPKYFVSDWLNEYLIDKDEDDYRFVYMGPKGTWTPFHTDVFSSFSWSTNIYGIKKWLFVIPNDELKLVDSFGNFPFKICEDILIEKDVKFITILQYENESIFVPSGWFHQVFNVSDTISINHNWFNGCNIKTVWCNLEQNLEKVINEIEDCRDMDNFDEHCQIMLKASFGMNFIDFINILQHITTKRAECVNNNENLLLFDKYTINKDHILFDLGAVNNVVKIMKTNFTIRNDNNFYQKCVELENLTNF